MPTQPPAPTNTLPVQRAPDALPIARRVFGDERVQILKDVIAKGCTDEELEVFALVCQRTKLDPFARPPQIYAIKRWDSRLKREVLTPQASIDSFRLVAARTREYMGQVGPMWCGADGVWKDLWLANEPPAAARVGVWRKGFKEPVWSVATWRESAQVFNGKLGDFWERMPALMLAKVAETNALKRAFPNDTEGIELGLIDEEIRQQQSANAQRYVEIFGTDEDRDRDGVPPRRALNAAGQIVDAHTGEVLNEDRAAEVSPSAAAREGPGETSPSPGRPSRADLWAENRRLANKATELGLSGVPTLPQRPGDDVIAEANAEMGARIRAYEAGLIAPQPAAF